MGDRTSVRDRRESESLAGPSLRHEMKTPVAAIRAATDQLQKNLQVLLPAVDSRGEPVAGRVDLLRFLANALASPRAHVPATGLDSLRRTSKLVKRLEEAGLGEKAGEAARVILRGGWEIELDEVIQFLLAPGTSGLLGLLDAVGKIRSNLASLEASAAALADLAAGTGSSEPAGEASRASFDVGEALQAALATIHHAAGPAVGIETDCAAGLTLIGGRARFRQVVINLVTNALSALPDSGGKVAISAREEAGTIVVRVEDNGRGVPEELRDVLFTPFATGRADSGGTGLGLFLARRILEEHGGTLSYLPEEEKTVFEARFPRGARS